MTEVLRVLLSDAMIHAIMPGHVNSLCGKTRLSNGDMVAADAEIGCLLCRTLVEWRLNAYTCDRCHGVVVTREPLSGGTTPMFLGCRATEGCGGRMGSAMYPRFPWPPTVDPTPTFEWYAPDAAEARKLDEDSAQHVRSGGLLLRPVNES